MFLTESEKTLGINIIKRECYYLQIFNPIKVVTTEVNNEKIPPPKIWIKAKVWGYFCIDQAEGKAKVA